MLLDGRDDVGRREPGRGGPGTGRVPGSSLDPYAASARSCPALELDRCQVVAEDGGPGTVVVGGGVGGVGARVEVNLSAECHSCVRS